MTGVDAVVHLAALFRTGEEGAIWRANLDGTRHLVEAVAAHAPTARVVMASTGNVYDATASRPSREADACSPTAAYPASKLAAERLLRDSGLTWSILRLPFVYGDGDGHPASISTLAPRFGLHPAHTYSVAHHRDVAVIVRLALTGAADGRIVNRTDDAEMAELAGAPIEASAAPLEHPWSGRMDGSLARELGFGPTVPTIRTAAAEEILQPARSSPRRKPPPPAPGPSPGRSRLAAEWGRSDLRSIRTLSGLDWCRETTSSIVSSRDERANRHVRGDVRGRGGGRGQAALGLRRHSSTARGVGRVA